MNAEVKRGYSSLKFAHYGQALLNVARTYEKLPQVILEYVQNAIDVGAHQIRVVINFKRRFVSITDDGDGVSVSEFEEALQSVGMSSKIGKMGRYGFGLVSALGKCEYFTFTSCPKSSANLYRMWVFSTEDIAEQKTEVIIPNEKIPSLWFSRMGMPGKNSVDWRTRVHIEKFMRDNVLSRVSLEELASTILERFSVPMKKLGTTVQLILVDAKGDKTSANVRSLAFTGERIPDVTYSGKISGESSFELFLTKKRKNKVGKVSVGIKGDPFRIGFGDFSMHHKIFSGETIEVLSSGIFEGYIISEKCMLDPSRKGFVENDAFMEFCEHIERWVDEKGNIFYEESIDEKREKRYQMLGTRAMKSVEELLRKPEMKDLMDIVRGFKKGTIGAHHTEMVRTEIGEQDEFSIRVGRGRQEGDKKMKKILVESPKIPQNSQENDHPFTVAGEKGKKRVIVKGHSTGLQFRYEQIPGKPFLWVLDPVTGTLTFNVRHDDWQLAEKSGLHVMVRFQTHVAFAALNAAQYSEWEFAHEQAESHVNKILYLLIGEKK